MLGGFGGQGTINIGAPAGAAPVGPGTLVTPFVLFGGTNDLLVFNHTDTSGSYVFSPLIEGPGAVNVLAGVTTLTANNTYTGPTTVNGGALVVDGSIASSSLTTVNSGAALIGTGTVGQTVINSGGFLVPGHSPGTMTVNGSLAFQSGAFYVVQVNPATASNTNVSGTATLAGTVAAVFAPGAYTKQSYPILTAAGGLMGTRFDGLETHGLPPDFGARVNYIGNTAFLNLFAHLVPEVTPPGSTLPTVRPPPIGVVPGLPPSSRIRRIRRLEHRYRFSPSTSSMSGTRSTTSSTTAGRCRPPSRRCSISPAAISPLRWSSCPANPRPARRRSPSSSPTSSST